MLAPSRRHSRLRLSLPAIPLVAGPGAEAMLLQFMVAHRLQTVLAADSVATD